MYKIFIKKSAMRDLDALDDKTYIRVDVVLQSLRNDPFPKGVMKLRGEKNKYRIRKGKYRILYEIDHKIKTIIIYRIKLRKVVYD